MHLIALASFWAALLCLMMAGWVVRAAPRSRLHRLFFYTTLALAVWALGDGFMISAPNQAQAEVWYRVSGLGWTLMPALFFHFFVALTRPKGVVGRSWFLALAYMCGAVMCVGAVAGAPYIEVVPSPWGWGQIAVPGPWFIASAVYPPGLTVAGLALAARWGASTTDPFERAQARLIVPAGLVALILGVVSSLLLPALDSPLPEVTQILVLIWVGAVWWAIRQHMLLGIDTEAVAESVLATTSDAVVVVDRGGRITAANPAAEQLFGRFVSPPGGSLADLMSAPALTAVETEPGSLLQGPFVDMDFKLERTTGALWLSAASSVVADQHGRSLGRVITFRDRSRSKRLEREMLRFTATHDPLTQLPGRALMEDRVAQARSSATRGGTLVALALLDVDEFKLLNGALGHSGGDQLLCQIADRLRGHLRDNDSVGRFGGDEFLVTLVGLRDPSDVEVAVRRLLEVFDRPFSFGESGERTVTVSAGISVFSANGRTVEELLQAAGLALKRARLGGPRACCFYSPEMGASFEEEALLRRDLEGALERGELELHYQPLVGSVSHQLAGVEALLRWTHPVRGRVGPDQFVPTLERSGLILPVGEWVLRTACQQAAAWLAEGAEQVPVAVNVSARQLTVDGEFPNLVSRILQETGLPPHLLELELTESMAMGRNGDVAGDFQKLAALGVRLVIDDFGTGFSSLDRLRSLPISGLKIDRHFVREIVEERQDRAIVQAIAGMARALDLDLVVEGIETVPQLSCLAAIDGVLGRPESDRLQGYLFGRPGPAEQLRPLVLGPASSRTDAGAPMGAPRLGQTRDR